MDGLMQSLEQALSNSSWLVIPLVFLGGAATGMNPCVFPTIPVIIVTGHPDSDLMTKAARHAPVLLLTKPVKPELLRRTVLSVWGNEKERAARSR